MNRRVKHMQELDTRDKLKISMLMLIGLFLMVFIAQSIATAITQNNSTINVSDDGIAYSLQENSELNKLHVESKIIESTDGSGNQVSISGDSVNIDVDPSSKIKQENSSSNISVEIFSKTSTSNSNNSESNNINPTAPELKINGQIIELPENGKLRETIKDEDSTTKIRTNINNNGSSSISISTNSN